MFSCVAAVVLCVVAVMHSVLGEAALLRPLFSREWTIEVPRWAAQRIFRFAWHLTSIAWVGLAAALSGLPIAHAFALTCLISGVIIFVSLRGHLAWPLFFVASVFAWASVDAVPRWTWQTFAGAGAGLGFVLAGLHVYWAAGGSWGLAQVIPYRTDDSPAFRPAPLACLAVALALSCLAILLGWPLVGAIPVWGRWGLLVATAVLCVRAVGDGAQVGFSKRDRSTVFARADDALYTPLVVLLAFTCGSAWMLSAS